jgi:hypothetical protein
LRLITTENFVASVFPSFDVHGTLHRYCILLSTTSKMQRYTIFFIIVNALHVSAGLSTRRQQLKNCTHSTWYVPGLLAATASLVELDELMGGETGRNM